MLLLPAERGYVELLAQRGVALQARGGGEATGAGPWKRVTEESAGLPGPHGFNAAHKLDARLCF
jgi:hypothetical protein